MTGWRLVLALLAAAAFGYVGSAVTFGLVTARDTSDGACIHAVEAATDLIQSNSEVQAVEALDRFNRNRPDCLGLD